MNIAPALVLLSALALPPAILEAVYLITKRRTPRLGAVALMSWMPFSIGLTGWFAVSFPRAVDSGATVIEAAPVVLLALLNLGLAVLLFRKATRLWRRPAHAS